MSEKIKNNERQILIEEYNKNYPFETRGGVLNLIINIDDVESIYKKDLAKGKHKIICVKNIDRIKVFTDSDAVPMADIPYDPKYESKPPIMIATYIDIDRVDTNIEGNLVVNGKIIGEIDLHIDDHLSDTSTYPVQNKVIKQELTKLQLEASKIVVDSTLNPSSTNPVQNTVIANTLTTLESKVDNNYRKLINDINTINKQLEVELPQIPEVTNTLQKSSLSAITSGGLFDILSNKGSESKPIYFDKNGNPKEITTINVPIKDCETSQYTNKLKNLTTTLSTPINCNNVVENYFGYYNISGPSTDIGATTNDGALYSQTYNNSWVGQIAQDYRNGNLFIRGKNNGKWSEWNKIALEKNHLSNKGGTITGDLTVTGEIIGSKVYNTVNNDYAECFDNTDLIYEEVKHRIVQINDDEKVELANKNSISTIGIVSDNYGHLLGGSKSDIINNKKIPVGLAGTLYVDTKDKLDKKNLGKFIISDDNGYATISIDKYNNIVGKIIGFDFENNRYKVLLVLR